MRYSSYSVVSARLLINMNLKNTKPLNKVMAVYRIIDSLVVLVAWEVAYFIRFHLMKANMGDYNLETILMGIFILILTLIFYTHNNLYTSQRYFSWYREMFAVYKSHFQAVSTFVVLLYFLNPDRLSRIMIVFYSVFVVILSLTERIILKKVLSRLRHKGKNLKHVVLIGHNKRIYKYALEIINSPDLGLKIIGWLDSRGEAERIRVPVIANIDDIPVNDKNSAPDALILGFQPDEYNLLNDTLAHFNKTTLAVWVLLDIEHILIGYTIESFHGLPLIKINANNLSVLEVVTKRSMDIIGSITGLVLFSPVMFLVGLLVKLTSKGAVFYGQERMSVDGYNFTMWKFRSMRENAEENSGAVWTTKNDSRTTKIGSFIRKTSIDELPQLWNILRGDMSLIGPRPERPVLIERFKEDIPSYMLRHKMKSGLTGWAQVNGWRGDTSLEKRIEYDLYYIQNWSIFLDIKILFLTVLRGFINKNAY